jgi:hypothetical protein
MKLGHPKNKQTVCLGNYWDWEGDVWDWCPLEHAAFCDL